MLIATADAVQRQGLSAHYLIQSVPIIVPIIGLVDSACLAIYTGVKATSEISKYSFKSLVDGLKGDKSLSRKEIKLRHVKNAKDLTLICINNVFNVATLGIINPVVILAIFYSKVCSFVKNVSSKGVVVPQDLSNKVSKSIKNN